MASWCPNCGRQTSDGEKFCRQCGMPQHLKGDEASAWILAAQKPSRSESPHTRNVNQTPTASKAQTGPADLPPQNFSLPPQQMAYYPPAQPAAPGQPIIRLGDWLSGGW